MVVQKKKFFSVIISAALVRQNQMHRPRQRPQQWATTDVADRLPRKASGTGKGTTHFVQLLEASVAQFAASVWRTHTSQRTLTKVAVPECQTIDRTPKTAAKQTRDLC